MIATLVQSLFLSSPRIVETVLEIAVRTALLCLAVWTVHYVAGRKRLLLRSALGHLCLVGLVLLPLVVVIAPPLRVVTPFTGTQEDMGVRGVTKLKSRVGIDDFEPLAPVDGRISPATVEALATAPDLSDAGSAQHLPESNSVKADDSAKPAYFGNLAVVAATALYLVTLGILLIRLAASLTAVAALRRQSIPVSNLAWLQALDRWHSQFALRPPVQLLVAECVSVPIVVGWLRPAILLPPGLAQTIDRQAIDAVLLHELTHVGRGDYAWNVLLRIVSTIYWPHPFVWFTVRMVRQVREEVCDAVCVHWMGGVRTYCAILVDVAAGLVKSSEVALGMAMTRSSQLGRRLARLQQASGSDRGLIGRPTRVMISGLVILSSCLLGTVQIVSRAAAGGEGRPDSTVQTPDDVAKTGSPIGVAPDEGLEAANFWTDPVSKNQYFVGVQVPQAATESELQADEKPADSPQKVDDSKPGLVKATKVQRGMLTRKSVQPATLEPFGQISIHSRNAGIVAKVLVDVGDRVMAGAVLAEIDFPDIGTEIAEKEATVAQAEADEEHAKVVVVAAKAAVLSYEAKVAQAEVDATRAADALKFRQVQLNRVKHLFELKSIDERLVDEKTEQFQAAESESRSATAKIGSATADVVRGQVEVRLADSSLKPASLRAATARADLKRAQAKTQDAYRLIRSPIDGVVLEKSIEADVSIKPADGKTLFRLAGTGLITAVVNLPQLEGLLVKLNDPATVELEEPDKVDPVAGKVSRVAYSIDRVTRTLRTEITLPNADARLKPGMFVRATVFVGEPPDVLWIPVSALGEVDAKGAQATCVRIVKGRAVRTPVKLGRSNDKQAEVIEGLSEGDVVVVEFEKAPPDGEPLLDPILFPARPKGTLRPILLPGESTRTRVVVLPGDDLQSTLQGESADSVLNARSSLNIASGRNAISSAPSTWWRTRQNSMATK